jgi:hypothetical protein
MDPLCLLCGLEGKSGFHILLALSTGYGCGVWATLIFKKAILVAQVLCKL